MSFPDVNQRRVATNGIHVHIAEAGSGPLVIMLHGFPESWYSWRHQFAPIAAAGYHAVAPDMRGYGRSDKPSQIEAYNQVEITRDIIELISALGYDEAVVIGHDWGAPTAWNCALNHSDVVRAVGALSVPFSPRASRAPLETMKEAYKGRFFYQLYFQTPGVAEAELERDIRVSLRKFLYMASGDADLSGVAARGPDADLLTGLPDPAVMPAWLSDDDLAFYIGEFERSGFRGPLNYYRNHDLSWQLSEGAPSRVEQPAMFVAGDKDGVIVMAAEALRLMPERVADLRINELIPGIGHWTQQEAPERVNDAILRFLHMLDR